MAFNVSRGANGLRPGGARELIPGFTLGQLPLSKIALKGRLKRNSKSPFMMMFFGNRVRNSSPFRAPRCNTKTAG
jgi:hypothetical protein